jgi:heme/copper-type cytochrome/quinol oxidase subunit 2
MTSVVARHIYPASGSRLRGNVLLLLVLVVVGAGILGLPWPFSPPPTSRHLRLDSRQFEFEPGMLRVNKGDTVVITLTAADVVHGLYLDGYGLETRVEPGLSQTIRFVADKSGKFRYRCSVSCGTLHPFMTGELIVGPNTTFGRAVALTLLVVAGTMVYLWRFPPREPGETSA